MTTVKVVNINKTKKYSKKPFRVKDELYIYCGRPKSLSNPYEIGKDGDRDEVIEKFKELADEEPSILNKEIKRLIRFVRQTKPRVVVLGCHCKPLRCHCDVIKEMLDLELNPKLF